MDFRVLGPIEVSDGDRVIAVGGGQQRRLLAVLLANADRVVSLDRLVDCVWPDGAAPEGASRTVRTYVSRLRSALDQHVVVTAEPGYRVHLRSDHFDQREFEDGLATARRASTADAPARYDDALALWRGRAYDEFAEEWWARPEVVRLEALRLAALEERIDALLALDRPGEALPDLERLAAEHPRHERFTAQLVVALDRTGRGGRRSSGLPAVPLDARRGDRPRADPRARPARSFDRGTPGPPRRLCSSTGERGRATRA